LRYDVSFDLHGRSDLSFVDFKVSVQESDLLDFFKCGKPPGVFFDFRFYDLDDLGVFYQIF